MATTFMNLNLPTVLTTLGPEWASQINEAFEDIDIHDHSSGKGVKIKPAGIDINADLSFANNSITNLGSAEFDNLEAVIDGALNANKVYVSDGDLYFTNNSGVAVQLTSGGSIVTTPSAVESFEITSVTTDITIAPADTFVFLTVDTNAARQVTLPLASSVSAGRTYILKDKNKLSDTNVITLDTQGSDTVDDESSLSLNSPGAATWVIGDGVSKWYIF